MRRSIIFVTCILLGFVSWSQAAENRFQQFNTETEQAYAAYRKALFQTNMKDAEKSGKANQMFLKQWEQIQQKYSDQPPETFSTDPQWKDSLSNIENIAVKSDKQIKEGQLAEAHETLEAVRDELSNLRQRNSVIVFSDHINNYHEVMEGLLDGGFTPEKIDKAAMIEISGHLAVLNYLAGAIKENAPVKYQDVEKYQKLQNGLFASLEALTQAIQSENPEAISKSIKMLKPAYAKLFVNFG